MPVSPEKQGYIADLENKSTPELRELFDRQNAILRKMKFVQSLPDKGRKVSEFAAKLSQLIKEHEEIDSCSELLRTCNRSKLPSAKESTAPSKFKQQQNENSKSNIPKLIKNDIKDSSLPDSSVPNLGMISRDVIVLDDPIKLNTDNEQTQRTPVSNTVRLGMQNDCHDTDTQLESSIRKLVVSDESRLGSSSKGEHHVNSYERVIKKAEERPAARKEKFSTNRTLHARTIHELPSEFLEQEHVRSKAILPNRDHKSVLEDTDVYPRYKHDHTQMIDVSEALELQRQQKEWHQTMQAEEAARELCKKLNIRMEEYLPKDIDMKYREASTTQLDSDDDEEVDYPEGGDD